MDIKKIKDAAKHFSKWKRIYNRLCRSCKFKLLRIQTDVKAVGTDIITSRVDEVLENNMCPKCKLMIQEELSK